MAVAKGRDDVVLVHLDHRLVRMCLRLLRAEVWAQTGVRKLHRIDVRGLPKDRLDDIAIVVISRLVVTGGHHHRLHEELTAAGGYLKDGAFIREARVKTVESWLDDAMSIPTNERLWEGLRRRYDKHIDAIAQMAEARSARAFANTRKYFGSA